MSLCCKCGGMFGNQPLKITKWGHFKDFKWSWHKIETFWGARDFFGSIKWHERQPGPFVGPKKSRAPQKVEILCKGPFRILEMAPFCDFQRVYFQTSSHIYSTLTLVILCHLFHSFFGLFFVHDTLVFLYSIPWRGTQVMLIAHYVGEIVTINVTVL